MAPNLTNKDLFPHFERFLKKRGISGKRLAFYLRVFDEVDAYTQTPLVEVDIDMLDDFLEMKFEEGLSVGRQKAYRQVLEEILAFQETYRRARKKRGAAPSPHLVSQTVDPQDVSAQYGLYGAGSLGDDVSGEMPGASTRALEAAPLLAPVMRQKSAKSNRSFIKMSSKRQRQRPLAPDLGYGDDQEWELDSPEPFGQPTSNQAQQSPAYDADFATPSAPIEATDPLGQALFEALEAETVEGPQDLNPAPSTSDLLTGNSVDTEALPEDLFAEALESVEAVEPVRSKRPGTLSADSLFGDLDDAPKKTKRHSPSRRPTSGGKQSLSSPEPTKEEAPLDPRASQPSLSAPPLAASPIPGLPLPPSAGASGAMPPPVLDSPSIASPIPGLPLPPNMGTPGAMPPPVLDSPSLATPMPPQAPPSGASLAAPPSAPSPIPGLPLPPNAGGAIAQPPPTLNAGPAMGAPSGPQAPLPQAGDVAFSKLNMLGGSPQVEQIAVADDEEPSPQQRRRGKKAPSLRAAMGVELQVNEKNRQRLRPGGQSDADLAALKERLEKRIQRAEATVSKGGRKFRPFLFQKRFPIDQPPPNEDYRAVRPEMERSLAGGFDAAAKLFVPGVIFLLLAIASVAGAMGILESIQLGPAGWIFGGVFGALGAVLFYPGYLLLAASTEPLRQNTPQAALTDYYSALWYQNYLAAHALLAADHGTAESAPTFDPKTEMPIGTDFNHLPYKFFRRYWQVHNPARHLPLLNRLRLQLKPPELGKTHIVSGSVDSGAILLLIEGPMPGWYSLAPLTRISHRWYLTDGQLFPRPESAEEGE